MADVEAIVTVGMDGLAAKTAVRTTTIFSACTGLCRGMIDIGRLLHRFEIGGVASIPWLSGMVQHIMLTTKMATGWPF